MNIHPMDDWRIRVQGLDRLASSLQLPEVARFVSISGKKGSISLLQFLVRCLHDDRSQRVICSTLRAVRALLQALSTLDCVTELQATVPALCRHLGGGVSVAVKLEAVAAVKALMRTVRPGPVVEILFSDKCFESRSSKLRENSLLCLMYALMTFPSTEFNCTHLAQRVMKNSFNEPKRRVRQSILDCLAVLAQFVPRSHLRLDMSDIAQTDHNDALFFLEALHARLIRRTLPTVSPEGLILYAIQISGVHTGADIEWIMAGTGVLSSGSAHSRTQLDNAQRAFISPTENDSASSKRSWSSQDMLVSGVGMNNTTSPYTEIEDLKGKQEDSNVASPWVNDARQYQTYGRPLYLKFQINQNDGGYGTHDQGFPKLNTSYGSTNISRRQATSDPMNQTWPAITNTSPNKLSTRRLAMLEPLENQYGYYTQPTPPPHVSINPSSLPPLVQQEWRTGYRSGLYDDHYYQMDVQRTIQYDDRKQNRWSKRQEPEGQRRPGMNNSGDRENGILHKPVLARQNKFSPVIPSPVHVIPTPPREDVKVETEELHNHDLSATSSIHSYQVPSAASESKEEKEEMEKVSSDITPLPSLHQEPLQVDVKDVDDVDVTDDVKEDMSQDITTPLSSINLEALTTEEKIQGDGQEDVPSFEESQAPEEVTPVVVDLEQTEPEPKDKTPVVSPKKSSSRIIGKPRLRLRRPTVKDQQTDTSSSIYPDTMPPYEHPKEAVSKCLLQLENPDWEVTMQGLQGIVRLSRHHTAFLTPALHPVAVTVTKHIRNLRSQVSRAACQAAAQLIKSFGRSFEGEVDELAGALFNRTADTNKFLRADCNAALDTMIDNISPVKSINAVVNRGVKHQNAVVRTSASRLLLKLNEHLGPERTLSLPRDTRDAFLISSARFLTEGSLDTRRYAKEIFANLAQDNRLPSIMAEVVPSSIMRNISKVLTRLGAK